MCRRSSLLVSLLVALGATVLSYVGLVERGYLASDFQWPLRAGRILLSGENPYAVIVPVGKYPFSQYLYYPLPVAFAGMPFAPLDDYWAGAIFFGLSSGLLAYALCRHSPWRLLMFLSAPFWVAAYTAQWSPLLMAAAFLPVAQTFIACKPNLGMVSWLFHPTRKGLLYAAMAVLVASIVQPDWPLWWYAIMRVGMPRHPAPLFCGFGALLALGILAVRRRAGRVFLAMCVVPQSFFFYDQMPLWLVPKSPKQMVTLSAFSWLGFFLWRRQLSGLPNTGQYVPTAAPFVLFFHHYAALLVLIGPGITAMGRRARHALAWRRRDTDRSYARRLSTP